MLPMRDGHTDGQGKLQGYSANRLSLAINIKSGSAHNKGARPDQITKWQARERKLVWVQFFYQKTEREKNPDKNEIPTFDDKYGHSGFILLEIFERLEHELGEFIKREIKFHENVYLQCVTTPTLFWPSPGIASTGIQNRIT